MHVDPDLDARKLAAIVREDGRQPVIAGVALGSDAQDAAALLSHLADLELGLLQPGEDVARRHQKPLSRRRQHEPLADAQKQRRLEPRLDVAQLMTERRLREVQPIPGAREAARVGDGRNQTEVPDFEIHEYESNSSL